MRSSTLLAAAFAAGTHAVPFLKRDIVTQVAYVTVQATVTVTAGEEPESTVVAPVDTSTVVVAAAMTRHWGGWRHSSPAPSSAASTSEAPAPTTEASPTTEAPTSTQAPPTTEAPTSTQAPPTTEAPTSTQAPASSSSASYSSAVIHHHNIHRSNHSSPDITWDPQLAEIAQEWASYCNYSHNQTLGGGGYGQNIAAGAAADNISSIITEGFYNGEVLNFLPYYGETTPSNMSESVFDGFGHFTQVVWAGTSSVGCATVDCRSNVQGLLNVDSDVPGLMTVCNYKPAGNMLGSFNSNVNKGSGQPTMHYNQ